MKNKFFSRDVLIVFIVFIISRLVIRFFDIHFGYIALYEYWQYLDVETLKNNLLTGLWYDHAQPPGFNFLLGVGLKLFGAHAPLAFNLILKAITLINVFLLLNILKKLIVHNHLPLIISLIYMVSPGMLILETELFYTTFVSMLLLLSANFIIRFQQKQTGLNAFFIFLPLAVLCLTRSMYHLAWLVVISIAILFYYRKQAALGKLIASAFVCIFLVAGWYVKNYIIFGSFSASTWVAMNFSRNVFHDDEIKDSSKIEAYEPFSKISVYRKFISGDLEKKFAGINDRDLISEMKNDSFINENNINYIEVSKKYKEATSAYVKAHLFGYLKNVLQSTIIYFTPVTRYPLAEEKAKKIKYYDAVYSFNLSEFAEGKQQRRIAVTLSAIPKLIVYAFVFFFLIRSLIRNKKISLLNLFIVLTIAFVFSVSSLFEHYENMRFRYETEPLFLILLAQVIAIFFLKEKKLNEV